MSKKKIDKKNNKYWKSFDIKSMLDELIDPDDDHDPAINESSYDYEPWRLSREYLNLNIPYMILAIPRTDIELDLFRFRYYFESSIYQLHDEKSIADIFKAYSNIDDKAYKADVNRICKEMSLEPIYTIKDILKEV